MFARLSPAYIQESFEDYLSLNINFPQEAVDCEDPQRAGNYAVRAILQAQAAGINTEPGFLHDIASNYKVYVATRDEDDEYDFEPVTLGEILSGKVFPFENDEDEAKFQKDLAWLVVGIRGAAEINDNTYLMTWFPRSK